MKVQVQRFSPHQNAKVFAVLIAIASLFFVVPLVVISLMSTPAGRQAFPPSMLLLFPVMYVVLGYVSVLVACWLYNFMFKYIGGIEYEPRSDA